jgi:hypothetical protein
MKKISLTEAEVKVALRTFVEKHYPVFKVEHPWGMMSMTCNEKRIEECELIFSEEASETD